MFPTPIFFNMNVWNEKWIEKKIVSCCHDLTHSLSETFFSLS